MKTTIITIAAMSFALTGCTTTVTPEELSNNDLCYELGYSRSSGDAERFGKLYAELEGRPDAQNDLCLNMVNMGMENAKADANSPSGFETFINTVDAIGTAGHTNKHTVTVE